jgi:toxin-antitoxin system PIN domain toxin
VIVPDANVLLYAYHEGAPQNVRARRWVESAFSGSEPIGLTWQCITAFVRITTHNNVFAHPYTAPEALAIVRSWLAAGPVRILEPGARYFDIFADLLASSQASGPLVMDAALAAMAIEVGATLATTDRDFRRFDGLKLLDPLLEG